MRSSLRWLRRGGQRRTVPRWRRFLRLALAAVVAAVVFVVVWVAALLATNPEPSPSPGWTRRADLSGGRGETASTVRAGELFIIGGLRGLGGTSAAVSVYHRVRDEWRAGPDLPAGRHHAAAATLAGAVYVSGGGSGATDWTPRRDMWALRKDSDAWVEVEPMPEGRLGHAMVAVADRLYVVGGEGHSTRVLVFDPDEGWSTGAPLGEERDHLRAVVVDGEVWAMGGRDGGLTDRVDVYDPASDRWRSGPALPDGMSAMAVGVLSDGLHVVGGEDPDLLGGKAFDRHVVLPLGRSRWRPAADPILAVHGAGYGVIEDELFIAGGSRRQGVLSVVAWTGVNQSFRSTAEAR